MEAHLNKIRKHVVLKEYTVENVSDPFVSSAYQLEEDKWSRHNFKTKVWIKITKWEGSDMEFDLVGVDVSVANAIRRILLSEVPSMAIEKVFAMNNTSLIQDEILSHRLGLIPLAADPDCFEYKTDLAECCEPTTNEHDGLLFKLRTPVVPRGGRLSVYSSHIEWIPVGSQKDTLTSSDVGPVHNDILIAKLKPGQEIHYQMLAVKGNGRDHAKFSPVATAFYRLLPKITLDEKRKIQGEQAERLKKSFSPGVIELDERKVAYVANARLDTTSRNVYLHNDLKDSVTMDKIRDHFIFTIESVGAQSPEVLFSRACQIMINKCHKYLECLNGNLE